MWTGKTFIYTHTDLSIIENSIIWTKAIDVLMILLVKKCSFILEYDAKNVSMIPTMVQKYEKHQSK